jgi:hypothetical protein
MVGHGRMSDGASADVADLLHALVQQHTAMLQVQAEGVRLQRILVERLLGAPADGHRLDVLPLPTIPVSTSSAVDSEPTTPPWAPAAPQAGAAETTAAVAPDVVEGPAPERMSERPTVPEPDGQHPTRGARYYQRSPVSAARVLKPEDLDLMRRLQEMRDASDLILQFGPHKGCTLAQVAMHHPEYIRELVRRARRPEVRAAAGRLVEALDAAGEHRRTPAHGAARRKPSTGYPTL